MNQLLNTSVFVEEDAMKLVASPDEPRVHDFEESLFRVTLTCMN
jgi:hypothetical protein